MPDLSDQIDAAAATVQAAAIQGSAAGLVLSGSTHVLDKSELKVQALDAFAFRASFARALDELKAKPPSGRGYPPSLFLVPPRSGAFLLASTLAGLASNWTQADRQDFLSASGEPLIQISTWQSELRPDHAEVRTIDPTVEVLSDYLRTGHIRAADHGIFARGSTQPEWLETLARFGSAETGFRVAGEVLTGREPAADYAALDLQMLIFALNRLAAEPRLKLSVNASRASLNDPQWRRQCRAHLVGTSRSVRARLAVEVTETPAPLRPKDLAAAIAELDALGVKVWLDDIGTSVTALNEIRIAGVAGLKLDRSLSQHAFACDDGFGVVSGLAGFAAQQGIDFIVEGVEDNDQRQRAEDWGATHVQGFFAGQPTLSSA